MRRGERVEGVGESTEKKRKECKKRVENEVCTEREERCVWGRDWDREGLEEMMNVATTLSLAW